MSLNETIRTGLSTITEEPGSPWWMKLLAIAGVIFLFNTVFKTGFSLVYGLVYLFGLFKFIYLKINEHFEGDGNNYTKITTTTIEKVKE